MSRVYAARELEWRGNRLVVQGGGSRSPMTEIVPDAQWTDMWRVKRPNGSLTDMVNRSRGQGRCESHPVGRFKQSRTGRSEPVHKL
jgi:hypothetical protein